MNIKCERPYGNKSTELILEILEVQISILGCLMRSSHERKLSETQPLDWDLVPKGSKKSKFGVGTLIPET